VIKLFLNWLLVLVVTICGFVLITFLLVREAVPASILFPAYFLVAMASLSTGSILGAVLITSLASFVAFFILILHPGIQSALVMIELAAMWFALWRFSHLQEEMEGKLQAARTSNEHISDTRVQLSLKYHDNSDDLLGVRRRIIQYRNLSNVAQILSSLIGVDEILNYLSSSVTGLISSGHIQIVIPEKSWIRKTVGFGMQENKSSIPEWLNLRTRDCFDSWVIREKQPLVVTDIAKDLRFNEKVAPSGIKSIVAAPLLSIEEHVIAKGLNVVTDEKLTGTRHEVVGILKATSPSAGVVDEQAARLVAILADMGATALDNSRLYMETERLALTDTLTRLYNRRYFDERLENEIKRAKRLKEYCSLLFIDIDNFKEYNDTFGHPAGDDVLVRISSAMAAHVRATDCIARIGGEEFAAIMIMTKKQSAKTVAEKMRKAIETLRFRRTVTISIGIAACPEDGVDRSVLMSSADKALYHAKTTGRNQVICYGEK